MEAVEYIVRPTTVKVYQFTRENTDEFVKMLWWWNYLTRLSGSTLTFQSAGNPTPGTPDLVYRISHGNFLIKSCNANGSWQIEVMDASEFEKKYMPGFPENRGAPK